MFKICQSDCNMYLNTGRLIETMYNCCIFICIYCHAIQFDIKYEL